MPRTPFYLVGQIFQWFFFLTDAGKDQGQGGAQAIEDVRCLC